MQFYSCNIGDNSVRGREVVGREGGWSYPCTWVRKGVVVKVGGSWWHHTSAAHRPVTLHQKTLPSTLSVDIALSKKSHNRDSIVLSLACMQALYKMKTCTEQ